MCFKFNQTLPEIIEILAHNYKSKQKHSDINSDLGVGGYLFQKRIFLYLLALQLRWPLPELNVYELFKGKIKNVNISYFNPGIFASLSNIANTYQAEWYCLRKADHQTIQKAKKNRILSWIKMKKNLENSLIILSLWSHLRSLTPEEDKHLCCGFHPQEPCVFHYEYFSLCRCLHT